MGIAALIISILSVTLSATTLWLTYLRRGRLRMTKPAIVFFGYDFTPRTTPKVFIRTLLYSTSNQGHVVESMHAHVRSERDERTFGFWGYGETRQLVAGGGLYVSKSGVAANHHFVLSVHEAPYEFCTGLYTIEVYARVVGETRPVRLGEIEISLNQDLAAVLAGHDGVLFELEPEGQGYMGHVSSKP